VTLLIATSNAGKLREYRTLLADLALDLCSLTDVASAPEVAETADTYLANARAKAHTVAAHARLPALADDSGLEVDALGGAPGVRSARFAADAGLALGASGDRANVDLLLSRLRHTPDPERTARFRCVIVVAHPDGHELIAEGTCDGLITRVRHGNGGFGYDPVFFYPPLGRTFAELAPAEKDRVSHRARAVERLREELIAFLAA